MEKDQDFLSSVFRLFFVIYSVYGMSKDSWIIVIGSIIMLILLGLNIDIDLASSKTSKPKEDKK